MQPVGIIILHFGDKKDTFECLKSLQKALPKNNKSTVFVVDNDPKNRLSISKYSYNLKISLIVSKKNLGYAGGFNLGIKHALKENFYALLLLSNDIVVKENLIQKQLSYIQRDVADLVSPVITYYDKPDTVWCMDGHLNTLFLFTRHPNMNKKIDTVPLNKPIHSDFAAACLMVKTTVFRKIGLMNERYFINAEDVEWCFRAKKAGFKLIYMPFPLAMHKVSANAGVRGTNLLTPLSAYYYARNFFIFLRDHKDTLHIFSGFFGQTFIRFPFYTLFRMASTKSALSYGKGYFDGLYYLITGKLIQRQL